MMTGHSSGDNAVHTVLFFCLFLILLKTVASYLIQFILFIYFCIVAHLCCFQQPNLHTLSLHEVHVTVICCANVPLRNYSFTHSHTGWARKVSLLSFAVTLSILPANFHNFWQMYTIGNLQAEDITYINHVTWANYIIVSRGLTIL